MVITTNIVTSNNAHGEVYSIQCYVIKFVSDLWQVGGFLCVLQFPPPIKLTATIYITKILLNVALNTITLTHKIIDHYKIINKPTLIVTALYAILFKRLIIVNTFKNISLLEYSYQEHDGSPQTDVCTISYHRVHKRIKRGIF